MNHGSRSSDCGSGVSTAFNHNVSRALVECLFALLCRQLGVVKGFEDGWTRSCQQVKPPPASKLPERIKFIKRRSHDLVHLMLIAIGA